MTAAALSLRRAPRAYGRIAQALERGELVPLEVGRLDKTGELELVGGSGHASVGGCASCNRFVDLRTLAHVGADVTAEGEELVQALKEAIDQLGADIRIDACGDDYGPACKGSNPAVDQLEARIAQEETKGSVDAKAILTLAGVDPTDANVKAFSACVLSREDSDASVSRGTLAYCALTVRDKATKAAPLLPKAHSTIAWRDRWATFLGEWNRFDAQWNDEKHDALISVFGDTTSLDKALPKMLARYSLFRKEFISAGGSTTAPSIDEPWSITTTVLVGAGVAGGLFLLVQALLRRFVG